jgi:hypothetical protein
MIHTMESRKVRETRTYQSVNTIKGVNLWRGVVHMAEAITGDKTPILGLPQATADQMRSFLRSLNPNAPDYSRLYLDIGKEYGVRGDLAFAQAIHETGAWRFGGSVRAEQHNFAGIGAISPTVGGASFQTPAEGIEAQIQHLYGYATTKPLPPGKAIVDPRFDLLSSAGLRGTAPNMEDLNGKWAFPGANYGQMIVNIWRRILAMPESSNSNPDSEDWRTEAMQWLESMQLTNSPHDPNAPVTWAEFGTVLQRLYKKISS